MNGSYRWRYSAAKDALSGVEQLTITNPYSGGTESLSLVEHRPEYIKLRSGRVSVLIINRPLSKNSGRVF
jgi:hypothetical protein